MKQTLISALLFSLVACGQNSQPTTQVDSVAQPSIADTTIAQTDANSGATNTEMDLMLNGTMTIPAQSNVTVALPISGIVSSFELLPGTFVKQGQTIAVLTNTEFIDMQQNYLDAAAQSEFLEAQYNRQKTLAQSDVTSQKSFQQSRAEFLSAKSRRDAMRAKLSMLNVRAEDLERDGIIEKLVITAPQNGYISDIMVNQGKFVAAGEPICQIINKSQILLNLIAYEKDLGRMQIGQSIEFQANGMNGKIFEATIMAIDQRVDPINRSVKIYAKSRISHPSFRPGMYVVAMIR